MKNPFRAFMDKRRKELPLAFLMFTYFFLVITSFWILKPLKKTLFIGYYKLSGFDLLGWHLKASQAELLGKVLNMVVAMAAVAVFTWFARRFRRQQLTCIFTAFFMAAYVLYSFKVSRPGDLTVWTFYLFGDLFSTLMVATFFAFLNDSVTPEKAKRLYGLVGLGGVVGGAFGSTVVRTWVKQVSMPVWMWVTFGLGALILATAIAAGRLVARDPPPPVAPVRSEQEETKRASAAFEGARLVFKSRYLLAIVGIVGLYEIVSTVMDFQMTATVEHFVSKQQLGSYFSTIYMITNLVALFVQLFLTGFIMTRFGVKIALLFLPLAILCGSVGFMILPVLWAGSLLITADNGFSYSINQSAKEALYVPTTREEKYKAKAFIDMFVQRFAKSLAVGVSLTITTLFRQFGTVRWLSLFTVVIVVLWLLAVRYAGSRFDKVAASRGKKES